MKVATCNRAITNNEELQRRTTINPMKCPTCGNWIFVVTPIRLQKLICAVFASCRECHVGIGFIEINYEERCKCGAAKINDVCVRSKSDICKILCSKQAG